MGLDCYWTINGETISEKDVTLPRKIQLCGGMLSGHGDGSFRGKVYSDLVEEITGVSLYQDIPNETIVKMADDLDNHKFTGKEYSQEGDCWDIDHKEFEDLRVMFRTYANFGASLHAWY